MTKISWDFQSRFQSKVAMGMPRIIIHDDLVILHAFWGISKLGKLVLSKAP